MAALVGLALACFEPGFALADEPEAASETEAAAEAEAAPAAPSDASATDTAAPSPGGASNRWANFAGKSFDVFPIRTLGLAAVGVGFGAFIASVPLVAPGFQLEGIKSSWEYFVMAPVEYTFVRPLGDF